MVTFLPEEMNARRSTVRAYVGGERVEVVIEAKWDGTWWVAWADDWPEWLEHGVTASEAMKHAGDAAMARMIASAEGES